MANLKIGSTGSEAEKLQIALKNAGYDVGAIDGVVGKKTDAALRQFQKDNGLNPDGVAGPLTNNKLYGTPGLSNLANGGVLGAQIAAGNTKANTVTAANQGLNTLAGGAVAGAAITTGSGPNKMGLDVITNPDLPKKPSNGNNGVALYDDGSFSNGLNTLAGGTVAGANIAAGNNGGGTKGNGEVEQNLPELPKNTDNGGTADNGGTTDNGGGDTATVGTPAPAYTSGTYGQSDIVNQAYALLGQHNASKPGAYQSQWDAQIKEYLDKIMNRDKFSYNFNEDALYQMYKDMYIQQGQMAMMDTMGQAAAMTGGYGNSYAQTVGQQAYNQQLSELNNIIPELYQMAFDQYAYEGDQLYNQYGLLMDQENMDYGRYMDSYNMWADERDYLAGRYDSERNFDYNQWSDTEDRKWNEYVYGNNMSYQQGRDQVSDQNDSYNQLAGLISSTGYKPTADELNAAGMSEAQANALMNTYNTSKSGSDDKGNDPAGYDNGTLTPEKVRKLQEVLGVTVDEKWGPESSKAAGGLTADEAWAAYQNGTLKPKDQTGDTVNDYGLTVSRTDQIYDWLEKALTNPNIGSSFDPIKLINGSSFFKSDAERNYAKELLKELK